MEGQRATRGARQVAVSTVLASYSLKCQGQGLRGIVRCISGCPSWLPGERKSSICCSSVPDRSLFQVGFIPARVGHAGVQGGCRRECVVRLRQGGIGFHSRGGYWSPAEPVIPEVIWIRDPRRCEIAREKHPAGPLVVWVTYHPSGQQRTTTTLGICLCGLALGDPAQESAWYR